MYHSQKQIESIILVDKEPMVSIQADRRDEEPRLIFAPGYDFAGRGIDKATVERQFSTATQPRRRVDTSTWCS
eukprot:11505818-Karenia_brevis.AAC.1